MRKRAVVLLAVAAALLAAQASPALAHEERKVGGYHFVVGFGTEPAYAGISNSVQLLLSDRSGKPVTDLREGLKVDVAFGDKTASYPIEPYFELGEFGTPGDYRAWFIPTRPGRYSFHFTGKVNGQPVDETFTSGEKTFSDVEDPTGVEFPVQDPTVGQLSERIQREIPRVEDAVSSVQQDASNASDDAGTATTLAIVGLVVGALGLAVAIVSVVRTRRVS
jgi:hypothetical protein